MQRAFFPNPIPAIPFLNTDPYATTHTINVGQQANDRSGDPLRDVSKVNENFAKVTTAMDAVETAVAQTSALAGSARDIAAAALPAVQKNRPGGVAPLDADGKVPAGNLPDSVPMSQKGAAGGVAPLDAAGKVPAGHLPDSIPMSQKGAADGVTPDAAGKVPVAHLPKLDYLPVIQRGAPDGVAPLDAQGKVPAANLAAEDAIPLAQKGQPNGVAALAADGRCRRRSCLRSNRFPRASWPGRRSGEGSGRAGFPAMGSSCRGRRFRIWRRPSRMALSRSCPRPSGWRIRSSVAPTRSAMGQPAFACRTTTASLQARLARPFSEAMAPCPWTMARSRPARTRLMPTRSNPRSIWGRKRGLPFLGATTTVTPVFPRYTTAEGGVEANPTFVSGCFIIKVFGAVSRSMLHNWPPGSPLLTRRSRPTLTSSCSIPAVRRPLRVIYQNTVQTIDNPFPGSPVQVVVEHELNGQWFEPGWFCSTDRTGRPMIPFPDGA